MLQTQTSWCVAVMMANNSFKELDHQEFARLTFGAEEGLQHYFFVRPLKVVMLEETRS